MTSFLTHEGEIAAGLTVNFAQKTAEAASRPVRAVCRRVHSSAAKLGPLRQLMRRIDMSVVGGHADIARTSLFVG